MGFFDPTGTPIDKEEFIEFYSKCYYLNNSKVAEDEIMDLYNKGIKQPMDVMSILEWKLGRINSKRSQNEHKTVFRHEKTAKLFKTKTRSGEINAEKLSCYIAKHYDRLKQEDPASVFCELAGQNVVNLGSVYILTLVSFITKKCPIYDRFAHQAIVGIQNCLEPGKVVKITGLSGKSEKNTYQKYEENYLAKLKEQFPNNYLDRNVDQALWVYGHLFQQA